MSKRTDDTKCHDTQCQTLREHIKIGLTKRQPDFYLKPINRARPQ